MRRTLALSSFVLPLGLLVGCEGSLRSSGRLDAAGVGLDASRQDAPGLDAPGLDAPVPDAPGLDAPMLESPDAWTAPLLDGGMEIRNDAGPCGGGPLASRITFTTLAGGGAEMAYPTDTGGAVVAWRGGGSISLQRYDEAGAAYGSALSVSGDGLWGLAASPDAYGVLVSRGDALLLSVIGTTGAPIGETRLMGAVPHDVTNNEWFGDLLRAGRLDWDGSRWISYSTVQRLWPDGVAHYGDTLRTFAPNGAASGVEWDWGCSHSMEVRLTHNASGIGPLCSSDCYPAKGVFFQHRTQVFLDSSGDCRGFVAQRLGGIAAVGDGFWTAWTSGEGRGSSDPAIAHVGNDRTVAAPLWLSSAPGDASDMNLAPYDGGLLVAWNEGGGHIAALDAAGAVIGTIEDLDAGALAGASDFFVYASGDVGWVVGDRLARLRSCR